MLTESVLHTLIDNPWPVTSLGCLNYQYELFQSDHFFLGFYIANAEGSSHRFGVLCLNFDLKSVLGIWVSSIDLVTFYV